MTTAGPRITPLRNPIPAPPERFTKVYTCYIPSDWHNAKAHAGPGDTIVMATVDSRRCLTGLRYLVTDRGLVGPVRVGRSTPRSPWEATRTGRR